MKNIHIENIGMVSVTPYHVSLDDALISTYNFMKIHTEYIGRVSLLYQEMQEKDKKYLAVK